MSTPYTSQPTTSKAPSPAPGPGVLPTIPIPQDLIDDVNSASQATPDEINTDFIGHIQSAVRLDTPVVAASGSGFTTPSNNALGGTITPSGSVKISTGTRFVVQIQTGGIVGTATFKTSMDGGNTYGALQTTAASMTDATSGITLAFSGTFTASGTASFRSAYTPQAQWSDAAGNARSMADHIGYRRGRNNEYYEDWLSVGGGAGLVGAVSSNTGRLAYNLPAGCTATIATGSALPGAGPYLNISTTNVANATNLRFNTPIDNVYFQPVTSLVIEFEILMISQSAVDWQFGLMSSGAFSGTPANSETGLCLGLQASDTKWQLVTANGSAFTKTNTNITPATAGPNPDRITLELHGASSPYGALQNLFINDNLVASISSATPPAVNFNYSFIIIGTTTSGTNSAIMRISPVRMIWNRYLSIPSV